MFITEAFAQAGTGAQGDFLFSLLPFLMIFVIIYFLILRPQQKRVKQHREMIENVRRGDTVVTAGGLVGKVTKVLDEKEAQIEVAEGVKVKIVKQLISEVRVKGEPAGDS